MTLHLGDVPASSTLYIPFATYDSNGASVTLTGLAVTDIEIYADGGTTQRSSDAGYTLLDTDGIDFDTITGIHGFSIDLSDNTDAGFYAVGSFYWVVVSAVTVDSQTVNFIAATFRIVPAEASSGVPDVNVASTDSGAITNSSFASNAVDSSALATNAVTEIASGVWDRAQASHTNAGSFGEMATEIASILVDTGTTLDGKLDTIDSNVDSILVDTGTTLNDKIDTIDGNVDAILLDTAEIANLNDISTAEVNAEVLDVLNVDTYSEPGQGAPPAAPTIREMVHWLYKVMRNKKEQTGTTFSLYNDAGDTVDSKSTVSDDDTTATRGEMVSGP